MPKGQTIQEVAILKFFEEAPLDKAEMLFHIIKDKMRARSAVNAPGATKKKESRAARSEENQPSLGFEKQ